MEFKVQPKEIIEGSLIGILTQERVTQHDRLRALICSAQGLELICVQKCCWNSNFVPRHFKWAEVESNLTGIGKRSEPDLDHIFEASWKN